MGAWVSGLTVRPCVGPGVGELLVVDPDGDGRGVGSVIGSVGEIDGVDIAGSTLDSGDCNEGQWEEYK